MQTMSPAFLQAFRHPSPAFRVLAAFWSRDHSLDHSQLPKYPTSSATQSEITLASGS